MSTFNAGPEELRWYYTSIRDVVAERLPDTSIAAALDRAVAELVLAAAPADDHGRAWPSIFVAPRPRHDDPA